MEKELSGFNFIDHKGNKNARKRNRPQEVPNIGTFILYNETSEFFHEGNPGHKARRGVGKVIRYTRHMVEIQVNITLTYSTIECFRIDDIRLGILKWKPLKKFIYTKDKYHYTDLDLDNPHEDIKELIEEKENELKYF